MRDQARERLYYWVHALATGGVSLLTVPTKGRQMPARHPVREKTVAGQTVAVEPVKGAATTPAPSKIAVYAKAASAFIVAEAGAVGTWAATLPAGPMSRGAWIGLGVALATGVGAATGVAITTNAPEPQPTD